MTRHVGAWTAALLIGCAGGQGAGPAAAASTETRQRIVNLVPFDIANCAPHAIDLGKAANEYALQAAFRAARPYIQECLADGQTFDSTKPVAGKVAIGLDASGPKVTATGDGVPQPVKGCIEKAVTAQLASVGTPAADAKPVSFEGPFERPANSSVRMGVNESSDVVGAIRLLLPQSCDCFSGYANAMPPELRGSVQVTRSDVAKYADRLKSADGGTASNAPVVATLAPVGATDANATQLASCVNGKVGQLQPKIAEQQLIVPSQFLLINSNAGEPAASVEPQLQFAQLDAVREQRQAEAFAALGRRQSVADGYDGLVQRYQTGIKSKDVKKRRAADQLVSQLKTNCAGLVKADVDFTKALESQAAVEQQALTLAQSLKAKDPSWADAETAATAASNETKDQIAKSKQLRDANEKACPKTKF